MFRKVFLGLALVAGVASSPGRAAMIVDGVDPAGETPLVQQAQIYLQIPVPGGFFFGGHDGCWYDDGWRGPGWYWCGYGYRQGYGWFGGEGFNGWTQHRYERDWHGGHGGGGGGDHHHDFHGGGGGGGGHHEMHGGGGGGGNHGAGEHHNP
jgi:hypothetical protein